MNDGIFVLAFPFCGHARVRRGPEKLVGIYVDPEELGSIGYMLGGNHNHSRHTFSPYSASICDEDPTRHILRHRTEFLNQIKNGVKLVGWRYSRKDMRSCSPSRRGRAMVHTVNVLSGPAGGGELSVGRVVVCSRQISPLLDVGVEIQPVLFRFVTCGS